MSLRNRSNSFFPILIFMQRSRSKPWERALISWAKQTGPSPCDVVLYHGRLYYICKYCIIFSNTVILLLFPRHGWQFPIRILKKYKEYIFSKLKYGMEITLEWFAKTSLQTNHRKFHITVLGKAMHNSYFF